MQEKTSRQETQIMELQHNLMKDRRNLDTAHHAIETLKARFADTKIALEKAQATLRMNVLDVHKLYQVEIEDLKRTIKGLETENITRDIEGQDTSHQHATAIEKQKLEINVEMLEGHNKVLLDQIKTLKEKDERSEVEKLGLKVKIRDLEATIKKDKEDIEKVKEQESQKLLEHLEHLKSFMSKPSGA
jgi:hypothetical protein